MLPNSNQLSWCIPAIKQADDWWRDFLLDLKLKKLVQNTTWVHKTQYLKETQNGKVMEKTMTKDWKLVYIPWPISFKEKHNSCRPHQNLLVHKIK
jgi:hypothetical protein